MNENVPKGYDGIGIVNNKIAFFKYEQKDNGLVPSKYKFRLNRAHVPYVIKSLKHLLQEIDEWLNFSIQIHLIKIKKLKFSIKFEY